MPEPREDLGRPAIASCSVKKQVCQREKEQRSNVREIQHTNVEEIQRPNVGHMKRQMSSAPCGERLRKRKVSCLRRKLSKSSPDITSSSSSSSDWSFDELKKDEVRGKAGEENQDSKADNLVSVLPIQLPSQLPSQLPHTSTDFSRLSARWPMLLYFPLPSISLSY